MISAPDARGLRSCLSLTMPRSSGRLRCAPCARNASNDLALGMAESEEWRDLAREYGDQEWRPSRVSTRAKERAPYIPYRSMAPSTLGGHIEPSCSHYDIPDIRIESSRPDLERLTSGFHRVGVCSWYRPWIEMDGQNSATVYKSTKYCRCYGSESRRLQCMISHCQAVLFV